MDKKISMSLELRKDYIEKLKKEEEKAVIQDRLNSIDVIYSKDFIKYRKRYLFFLVLSILGLVEILTIGIMNEGNLGVISFILLFVLGFLFGNVGAMIGVAISLTMNIILSFIVLWVPIALIERNKMKKALHEANK